MNNEQLDTLFYFEISNFFIYLQTSSNKTPSCFPHFHRPFAQRNFCFRLLFWTEHSPRSCQTAIHYQIMPWMKFCLGRTNRRRTKKRAARVKQCCKNRNRNGRTTPAPPIREYHHKVLPPSIGKTLELPSIYRIVLMQ